MSGAESEALIWVGKFNSAIFFPLMRLMMAVAFLVFLYGLFQYVTGSADEEARVTGRKHMLWGIIGFLIMISAVSILSIALNTFDIDRPQGLF